MKKSILFVINGYYIGGVTKAFISFVKQIDFSRYNVFLFSTRDSTIWQEKLPKQITVLHKNEIDKNRGMGSIFNNIFCRVMVRMAKSDAEADYWAVQTWNIPDEKFDYVICYNGQDMATISIACRFRAKKYLIWFHGAVSTLGSKFITLTRKKLAQFSTAVSVSKTLVDDILSVYPQLKEKIAVVHNSVDAERIFRLSLGEMPITLKRNAIVTVGRLSYEKGQDMIPATVRMLLDAGYEVYWYLVGEGTARKEICSEIERYNVGDNVILLGETDNPFPYMRACDLYVQPSRTEGWGLTVQECKVVGTPSVVTPIPAFLEQIRDKDNGVVADSVSAEALFRAVGFALDNISLLSHIESNLKKNNYDSKYGVIQFYHVLEKMGDK